MSLTITFNETDSYYVISDSADLTFQDGDCNAGILVRVDDNAGTAYQYVLSNNAYAVNNSFNLFLAESSEASNPDHWQCNVEDGDGTNPGSLTSLSAPGPSSKWILIIYQRDTSADAGEELQLWFCEEKQDPTLEAVASDASFGSINGGDWNIGRRRGGTSTRYYGGHAAWFFKGDFAWTEDEIRAMGAGVTPYTMAKSAGKSLDVCIKMDGADATLLDITGNGNDATRNGSPVTAITEPNLMSAVKRAAIQ